MLYPSLKNLLGYQNNNVFSRYESDYPNNLLKAPDAMHELVKYMWLSRKHAWEKSTYPDNENLKFKCVVHTEMSEIDDMWHTFLLFTNDYHLFCMKYLDGKFFHHVPNMKMGKLASKEKYTAELERYLSYIYDNLGQDTVLTWFPT